MGADSSPHPVGGHGSDDGGEHGGDYRDDDAVDEAFAELRVGERGAVPAEREAFPDGEAAGVEAEGYEDQQRRVQEGQRGGGIDAQRTLFHMSSFATRLRIRRLRSSALANIRTSDAAEPKGQSRAVVNWF